MKRLLAFGLVFVFLLVPLAPLPGLAQVAFDCASVTEIPEIECEALVMLYNSTNGPGWKFNYHWLETVTPSDWQGVSVESGHVTGLVLEWNKLTGAIPAELGNLSSLEELDLPWNYLSVAIPASLGNLTAWSMQLWQPLGRIDSS
jgi:hypothetical protein